MSPYIIEHFPTCQNETTENKQNNSSKYHNLPERLDQL